MIFSSFAPFFFRCAERDNLQSFHVVGSFTTSSWRSPRRRVSHRDSLAQRSATPRVCRRLGLQRCQMAIWDAMGRGESGRQVRSFEFSYFVFLSLSTVCSFFGWLFVCFVFFNVLLFGFVCVLVFGVDRAEWFPRDYGTIWHQNIKHLFEGTSAQPKMHIWTIWCMQGGPMQQDEQTRMKWHRYSNHMRYKFGRGNMHQGNLDPLPCHCLCFSGLHAVRPTHIKIALHIATLKPTRQPSYWTHSQVIFKPQARTVLTSSAALCSSIANIRALGWNHPAPFMHMKSHPKPKRKVNKPISPC